MSDANTTAAERKSGRKLLYDKFSLSEAAKWNNLRGIGNSTAAKASLAVPILGYVLLFNQDVINYLKLHSSFCADCSVSWRLHFFYFGCCCFALGSIVYAIRCPVGVRRYAAAHDFFQAEQEYYRTREHTEFLIDNVERERQFTHVSQEFMYPTPAPGENYPLVALMGEYYFMQNRNQRATRIAVLRIHPRLGVVSNPYRCYVWAGAAPGVEDHVQ